MYIYQPNPRNEKWWKCNDGDVTHATWNDVMNDSYGGSSGSSSAYSLIYQSQEQFDLDADTPDEELEPDQSGKSSWVGILYLIS